jgi:hypothetical protein
MVRVVIRGVAGVDVAGGDRDLGPGQGFERGEQCRLVLFDGEHEPRAAVVEVLGVGALGVQGVRGDHRVGQGDTDRGEPVEQRGEHRDLVGLRADLDLTQDQGVLVGRGREQMHLVALGVGGTAHCLAIHRDRDQLG